MAGEGDYHDARMMDMGDDDDGEVKAEETMPMTTNDDMSVKVENDLDSDDEVVASQDNLDDEQFPLESDDDEAQPGVVENKDTADTSHDDDSPPASTLEDSSDDESGGKAGIVASSPDGSSDNIFIVNNRLSKMGKVIIISVILLVIGAITLGLLAANISKDDDDGGDVAEGNDFNTQNSNFDEDFVPPPRVPSVAPSEIPSDMPSYAPSEVPSVSPSTSRPSVSPTGGPTSSPSEYPSVSPSTSGPTMEPSASPTETPTANPTESPTGQFYPVNPVPRNPPQGYFNYDRNDNQYGPRSWDRIDTSNHPLAEFTRRDGWGPFQGHLEDKDVLTNRCGTADRRQSPKNLRSTGGVPCELLEFAICDCDSHHEIRTRVSSCRQTNKQTKQSALSPTIV